MALVSVHRQSDPTIAQPITNPDLKRAKDLIELRYSVKVAYEDQGVDADLIEAREKVDGVLRDLKSNALKKS